MDGDMNDIFNKLNNFLNDKEMSANLKNIVDNFSSSSNENNTTQNSNSSKSNQTNEKAKDNIESTNNPEFDINTILKIKRIMDTVNTKKDDPRATLLQSLKPYLNDTKKEKIDTYIKFLQMAKVLEFINPLSEDLNKNV